MLCGQQVDYLGEHLLEMDWLALAEENRRVQFRGVPELFPVAADFYARLFAGQLGFAPVRHFVVEPQFMGLRFADRDAEPSFLAYDHPSVRIFQRQQAVDVREVLAVRRAQMDRAKVCADGELWEVALALAGGRADVLMLHCSWLRVIRTRRWRICWWPRRIGGKGKKQRGRRPISVFCPDRHRV